MALAMGAILLGVFRSRPEVAGPLSAQTTAQLESVILPKVAFQNATIEEALGPLIEALDSSKNARHLRIVLWSDAKPPEGFRTLTKTQPSVAISGLEHQFDEGTETVDRETPEKLPARYSVSLSKVPASEFLRYVSGLYDCAVGQKGNDIYLVQGEGTFDQIIRKVMKVHGSTFGISPTATHSVDVQSFFESSGVIFPQEGKAVYHPRAGRLVVIATQDGVDLCDAIVTSWASCYSGAASPSFLQRCREWIDWRREQAADHFYTLVL